MQSDRVALSDENCLIFKEQYSQNEHFQTVVWPRLVYWLRVKEQCDVDGRLIWTFRWSPVQVSRNEIAVSLPDSRGEFHFYYAIPLMQSLKVLLYLGDNTFNFFEAHPLLVQNGIVGETEFPVDATLNSLPCLVLSNAAITYPTGQMLEIAGQGIDWQGSVLDVSDRMTALFARFNPALDSIITGKWRL
jgi:hypothetical protein